MTPDRRDFLKQAALGAALVTGAASEADAQGGSFQHRRKPRLELDQRTVEAVADAVLPESLGADGRRRAARDFLEWLRHYPAGLEEMHGYGYAEITFTPEDPAPRWAAQLEVLEGVGLRTTDESLPFRRLPVEVRREVLASVLGRVQGPRLPSSPLAAPHIAIAIMAHWAATSEAVDLAYGARIGRANCDRPLGASSRQPLPLAPDRR